MAKLWRQQTLAIWAHVPFVAQSVIQSPYQPPPKLHPGASPKAALDKFIESKTGIGRNRIYVRNLKWQLEDFFSNSDLNADPDAVAAWCREPARPSLLACV